MPDKPPIRKPQKNLNDYTRYSGMVFQMAAIMLAGTFGGIKLDKKVSLEFPLFTVTLSFISVIFAIYIILKDFIGKNKHE